MDNNLSYIKERILTYIEYKGVNKNHFIESIGMTYGNFKGSNKYRPLNSDAIENILSISEDLNPLWLLTGKGEMLKPQISPKEYIEKEEVNNIVSEPQEDIAPKVIKYNFKSDYFNINNQLIPLYEIEAAAGLNTLFSNQTDQSPIDYISVPNAPKCDGALFVRGDSMYPIMKSGDIVCYKRINDMLNNIRYGEVYLLYIDDGDDEYLTIKYVQTSERGKEFVKLVSHNQYHAPKDEAISNIKALAIIKLSIRYNTIS